MAYVKKYATEEERRLAKSMAGKKGAASRIARGNNKGGRPKGSLNKNPSSRIPTRTLTVRQPDYEVFVKCAYASNVSQVEFLHTIAEKLKQKNPHLFEPNKPEVTF
jgi:hypothetical protein